MDLQSNPVNEILYVSFNQDFTCFICGTESGFRVYSTDPFQLTHRRDFRDGGGLGVIAMLFRTNILAFAGGGSSPRFQPNQVVIWDDRKVETIARLTFKSTVKSVRFRRDMFAAVLEGKVYVYSFPGLTLLDSIETTSNPKGLCCLSVGNDRVVLVCPGMQQGRVLVVVYSRLLGDLHAPLPRERTTIVAAHDSVLAAMAIDYAGARLATASDKGTIVRVFDTSTGARLQELRRGADRAEIHSLTFSPAGDWLAVSSDKGTVHVFAVCRSGPAHLGGRGAAESSRPGPNARSHLQRLSRVLPAYFSSEWSLAQLRVNDHRCIAAFGAEAHTVVAVCASGSYYRARFDPVRGGEMVREEYAQFDDGSCGGGSSSHGAVGLLGASGRSLAELGGAPSGSAARGELADEVRPQQPTGDGPLGAHAPPR